MLIKINKEKKNQAYTLFSSEKVCFVIDKTSFLVQIIPFLD